MASVARVTEISAISEQSFDDAISVGIEREPNTAEPPVRMGQGARSADQERRRLRLQGEPPSHLRARVTDPRSENERGGYEWNSTATNSSPSFASTVRTTKPIAPNASLPKKVKKDKDQGLLDQIGLDDDLLDKLPGGIGDKLKGIL